MAAKGEPKYVTLGVKTLKFNIQGETYIWDFILYEMRDYDIILGMDWLSSNQAFLDCERKRVLRGPCKSEMELIFQGSLLDKESCIVTSAQVSKLLGQGCQAFIASLVDSNVEPTELSTIPVVSEFPDIFPEELLNIPPKREVEFTIDIAPELNRALKHHTGWHRQN